MGGGGSRIRYSIKNLVLIRDSVSEISLLIRYNGPDGGITL